MGRVLYRLGPGVAVAGRVMYRMGLEVGVAGRVLYRLSPGMGVAGRVLYRVSGGLVLEAGESSPCSVAWWWKREKILPAREKWPDFGVFGRAGRVLYRLGQGVGVPGEFCTGWARAWGSLGAGLLCGAPLARKSADDGLLFGHTDDAGALAQGQGRGHGHGAGAAREHEDNQHVFGAHGQDWGDAGGQADGREC